MKRFVVWLGCLVLVLQNLYGQKSSELRVFTKLDTAFEVFINGKKMTEGYVKDVQFSSLVDDELVLKIKFQNRKYATIRKKILLRNPITERNLKVECQVAIGKRGRINLGRSVRQLFD